MRLASIALLATLAGWAPRADAAPDWTDVPALVAASVDPVAAELRACARKLPLTLSLIATRTKTGTKVAMPLNGVGHRGLTDEERCLHATTAKIELPALPAEIERMVVATTIVAATAAAPAPDKAFDDWRDPVRTVATVIDTDRRAALAACSAKPRTVRLILDRRRAATRLWLPAWQFHSASGDGTTPAAERRIKACLSKAIRGWTAPVLPAAMGELQLALAVAP